MFSLIPPLKELWSLLSVRFYRMNFKVAKKIFLELI